MFDYKKIAKQLLDIVGIDAAVRYLVLDIGLSPKEANDLVYSLI